ncbi:hypothetical protein ACFL1J_04195, partial [Pseudomonadota bacterium]
MVVPTNVNLTLDDGNMDEGTLGTGSFTVTRSNDGNVDAAINVYFTFGGTALNGVDYDATAQGYVNGDTRFITIPAGQLSASSTITPRKDNLIEGEETIVFTLQPDNTTYTVGPDVQAEMVISDDVTEVNLTL